MQITNVGNNDSESWSFTGVISLWIFFSLFVESALSFLIELFLPFSQPGYSYLQVLILRVLILSAIPIWMIGLVINFLPYQTIDYSRPAIIKSLEHKLLFLCTSPLLYLGYLLANKVGSLTDSLIATGFGYFSTGLISWITILGWIFFSLWCWEHFFGGTSITLQRLKRQSGFSRTTFQSRYEKDQKTLYKFSLRYTSFMLGLPILFVMSAVTFVPNSDFLSGLLIFIGFDIFVCFFSISILKNYLNNQGHSLTFLNQIPDRLFGEKDIDSNFFNSGFFLMVLIFFFSPIFDDFLPKGMNIIFYWLLVLIFILMVWSNQIKALLHPLLPKRFMKDNSPRRILLRESK